MRGAEEAANDRTMNRHRHQKAGGKDDHGQQQKAQPGRETGKFQVGKRDGKKPKEGN